MTAPRGAERDAGNDFFSTVQNIETNTMPKFESVPSSNAHDSELNPSETAADVTASDGMETVTISKKKYQTLERRAALYERVFGTKSAAAFPIESYTTARVQEFLKADRLNEAARKKALHSLKRSR